MKEMTANDDCERFRTAQRSTRPTSRRPRADCVSTSPWPICRTFCPRPHGLCALLDIGCGTGAIAVRLARLGLHVTLLDASVPMLDFAERAAREAGVTERIALKHGDAAQVANLFPPGRLM